MAKNKKKFGISLFGFNKIQVDNYIKNIKDDEQIKLNNIKCKVEELEFENKTLKEELEALKKEMELEMKSEEFMSYSIKRAEEWSQIILAMSKEKALEIENYGTKEEEIINNKIISYNKIIKNSKKELNKLLTTEIKKSDEIIEEMSRFINEKNKYINNIKDRNDCKIIDYVKLREVKNSTEKIEEEKIQDETVKEIAKDEIVKDEIVKEKQENLIENDFWGEDFNETSNKLNNEEKNREKVEDIEKLEKANIEVNVAVQDKSSSDITNEIKNIRGKYIVGKFSGGDLFDNKGDLIVGKDSVITMEIVDKAEKEGKLAELIVAMKLPEKG